MEQKHILDYLDETRGKRELKSLFQIVMDEVLKELKLEGAYEVSLSLVSKEKIHELNKKYRNIDRPTDVLT
ncbi:MAG: rRNA maturation RNase YbeY, partial [Candidatus Enterosoma sp.]